MSITTTPVFYYGFSVTTNDIYLNFDEGGLELTGIVTAGNYSFEGLADEIERVLNSAGGQAYSVITNRADRTYTISASSNFSLLFSSGTNSGLSVGSVIGFTTDYTGANTYTGEPAGSEFIPQFPLQDFIGFEDFQEYSDANINESSAGVIETYSIGLREFMEFNIAYTTDNEVKGLFRQTTGNVAKLRDFMQYLITKGDLEFMKDDSNRSNYSTIVLDRTAQNSTGTGYKLKELYSRNLQGFYETGTLKFRKQS